MNDTHFTAQIRAVNREFREKDESHLWPIDGRFNVTARAIRRIQHLRRMGLVVDDIESYRAVLDSLISLVVNSPNVADYEERINWKELNA